RAAIEILHRSERRTLITCSTSRVVATQAVQPRKGMIISTTREQVEVPGGRAERPTEIPARGWLQVAKRGWKEAKTDQVPLLAAGVAFYAFLAIFPALIALVSIYGLFADPSTIANQLGSLTAPPPEDARQVITDQVTMLASRRSALSVGLIISIVIAL